MSYYPSQIAYNCGNCNQKMYGRANLCEQCEELLTLRVTVRDLKDRLKVLARIGASSYFRVDPMKRDEFFRAANLRRKNWRKA